MYLIVLVENRHSSCPLQEGEWPDQGERQTPGDGGASHPPVQGTLAKRQHAAGFRQCSKMNIQRSHFVTVSKNVCLILLFSSWSQSCCWVRSALLELTSESE